MRRVGRRWTTTFGSWVQGYGVQRLASDLSHVGPSITQNAIYNWIAGFRTPHPSRAVAITQISGGHVSLDDVYRHRSEVEG